MNYSLKNAISAFILLIVCSTFLKASPNGFDIKTVKVGRQPLTVKFDSQSKKYHVFCMGFDQNFNGEFDAATDERSSWWTIEDKGGTYVSSKIKDFTQGFLNFPLRMNFLDADDYNPRTAFIPFGNVNNPDFSIKTPGKVVSFDLDNYKELDPNVLGYYTNSVSSYGPHLLVTKNLGDAKSHKVAIFNLSTKSSLQEITTGINTNQVLAFNGSDKKLYAIATSDDYSDSSTFYFAEVPHMSDFNFSTFKIGKTVNHISQNKDLVAITSNEGHTVTLFNIVTNKKVKVIPTETTGFEGPRECIFLDDNNIAVSTYSGKLSIYNVLTGNLIQKFLFKTPNDGNESLEGLLFANNKLVVTNPYANYNSSDSKVYIIDNPLSKSGIEEEENEVNVYPNPVTNYIYVNGSIEINSIELIDMMGISYNLNNSEFIDLKSFNLSNGMYLLRINSNNKTILKKISINN